MSEARGPATATQPPWFDAVASAAIQSRNLPAESREPHDLPIADVGHESRIDMARRAEVPGKLAFPRFGIVPSGRLAEDFEASIESTTTWLYIAIVKLMSRRLGRA